MKGVSNHRRAHDGGLATPARGKHASGAERAQAGPH